MFNNEKYKNMKEAFMVGNGLDISLGLKTKYIDFYEHLRLSINLCK